MSFFSLDGNFLSMNNGYCNSYKYEELRNNRIGVILALNHIGPGGMTWVRSPRNLFENIICENNDFPEVFTCIQILAANRVTAAINSNSGSATDLISAGWTHLTFAASRFKEKPLPHSQISRDFNKSRLTIWPTEVTMLNWSDDERAERDRIRLEAEIGFLFILKNKSDYSECFLKCKAFEEKFGIPIKSSTNESEEEKELSPFDPYFIRIKWLTATCAVEDKRWRHAFEAFVDLRRCLEMRIRKRLGTGQALDSDENPYTIKFVGEEMRNEKTSFWFLPFNDDATLLENINVSLGIAKNNYDDLNRQKAAQRKTANSSAKKVNKSARLLSALSDRCTKPRSAISSSFTRSIVETVRSSTNGGASLWSRDSRAVEAAEVADALRLRLNLSSDRVHRAHGWDVIHEGDEEDDKSEGYNKGDWGKSNQSHPQDQEEVRSIGSSNKSQQHKVHRWDKIHGDNSTSSSDFSSVGFHSSDDEQQQKQKASKKNKGLSPAPVDKVNDAHDDDDDEFGERKTALQTESEGEFIVNQPGDRNVFNSKANIEAQNTTAEYHLRGLRERFAHVVTSRDCIKPLVDAAKVLYNWKTQQTEIPLKLRSTLNGMDEDLIDRHLTQAAFEHIPSELLAFKDAVEKIFINCYLKYDHFGNDSFGKTSHGQLVRISRIAWERNASVDGFEFEPSVRRKNLTQQEVIQAATTVDQNPSILKASTFYTYRRYFEERYDLRDSMILNEELGMNLMLVASNKHSSKQSRKPFVDQLKTLDVTKLSEEERIIFLKKVLTANNAFDLFTKDKPQDAPKQNTSIVTQESFYPIVLGKEYEKLTGDKPSTSNTWDAL